MTGDALGARVRETDGLALARPSWEPSLQPRLVSRLAGIKLLTLCRTAPSPLSHKSQGQFIYFLSKSVTEHETLLKLYTFFASIHTCVVYNMTYE